MRTDVARSHHLLFSLFLLIIFSTVITTPGRAEAICQVEPAEIEFGEVDLGTYVDTLVTITNVGDEAFSFFVRAYQTDFIVGGDGAHYELSPGDSSAILVRFHPRHHHGSHEGELRIYGGECTNVPLSGFANYPDEEPPVGLATDWIGIYADSTATVCKLDVEPGVVTSVYVVAHLDSLAEGGIIAANFRLEGLPVPESITDNVSFEWFGDLTIGSPDFDFALAFTEPQTGPLVPLGRIVLYTEDPDWIGPDSALHVRPSWFREFVVLVDDEALEFGVTAGGLILNPEIAAGLDCADLQALPGDLEAILPSCEITTYLEYGVLPPGEDRTRHFTIKNTGMGFLEGQVTSSNPGFEIVEGGEPFSLGFNNSHMVRVRFESDTVGEHEVVFETGFPGCPEVEASAVVAEDPPYWQSWYQQRHIGFYAREDAYVCPLELTVGGADTLHLIAMLPELNDLPVDSLDFRVFNLPEPGAGGSWRMEWDAEGVGGHIETGVRLHFDPPRSGWVIPLGRLILEVDEAEWIGTRRRVAVFESETSGLRGIWTDGIHHGTYGGVQTLGCELEGGDPCGCGFSSSTPVAVSGFEVRPQPGKVLLSWEVMAGAQVEFQVEVEHDGRLRAVPVSHPGPGVFRALDEAPALAQGGEFLYRVRGREAGGEWETIRQIELSLEAVPRRTRLLGPHPNPFNATVVLPYEFSREQLVELGIYDLAGRRVAVLLEGRVEAGPGEVVWTGLDDRGKPIGSGVYFVRLACEEGLRSRKIVLIK